MKNDTELGRRVKKLIYQNRYLLPEIARLCNSTVEECVSAFEGYTGEKILPEFLIVGNEKQKTELRKLILQNQKVLLYGDNGVGKSSLPRLIANEIGWKIKYTYPRNTEDLLKDFAQLPLQTKETIFVVEGDYFYWRSYALVNHYIKESKNPIIIIVDKKETVHGSVSKQLVHLKLQPPTPNDVLLFLRKKYPEWSGNIKDVYDKDMRITLRNVIYGIKSYKPQFDEKLTAQKVAYNIIQGKATRKDIENCKDPLLFILNWLGNNSHNFYSELDTIDNVSFIDTYKYNYKKNYLNGILLNINKADKRAKMLFPPIKYKPPKHKTEEWEKGKKRKRTRPTPQTPKQTTLLKFGNDMVL